MHNKIDTMYIEDLETIARRPNSCLISAHEKINLEGLLNEIWKILDLVRVYTKKKGELPDFSDPVILTKDRGGTTIKKLCQGIHKVTFYHNPRTSYPSSNRPKSGARA